MRGNSSKNWLVLSQSDLHFDFGPFPLIVLGQKFITVPLYLSLRGPDSNDSERYPTQQKPDSVRLNTVAALWPAVSRTQHAELPNRLIDLGQVPRPRAAVAFGGHMPLLRQRVTYLSSVNGPSSFAPCLFLRTLPHQLTLTVLTSLSPL